MPYVAGLLLVTWRDRGMGHMQSGSGGAGDGVR